MKFWQILPGLLLDGYAARRATWRPDTPATSRKIISDDFEIDPRVLIRDGIPWLPTGDDIFVADWTLRNVKAAIDVNDAGLPPATRGSFAWAIRQIQDYGLRVRPGPIPVTVYRAAIQIGLASSPSLVIAYANRTVRPFAIDVGDIARTDWMVAA